MAKKRKRRIRRAVARWAWRKVHTWAADTRARVRKAVKPKVIIASAKQHAWERQFPDPNRPAPLVRVDEWIEEYQAVFSNGWQVPFQVDSFDKITLREAAYDAAELKHGTPARALTLVEIQALNELAEEALRRNPE